jgi:hypothetical protein
MLMNGGGRKNSTLVLRSGLLAASRRMGRKLPLPSFETPRKGAAPQDEGEDMARLRRDDSENTAPLSQRRHGSWFETHVSRAPRHHEVLAA